ncbi:hypothetical protein PIB30_002836 [Stylosanthes scabra]|uniref:DC1 domain-containing protein n=1 Tax=Stylosanthes scabra TaxID=79078 RepID=A0ABU6T3P5_9FABA|nr:hypothetical protein [Stylosanthes scabra]
MLLLCLLVFSQKERNSVLPTKHEKLLGTFEDNQSTAKIAVYEGERSMACDNNLLGLFCLSDLDPSPRRHPIRVCFDLDENGILKVYAEESKTGKKKEIEHSWIASSVASPFPCSASSESQNSTQGETQGSSSSSRQNARSQSWSSSITTASSSKSINSSKTRSSSSSKLQSSEQHVTQHSTHHHHHHHSSSSKSSRRSSSPTHHHHHPSSSSKSNNSPSKARRSSSPTHHHHSPSSKLPQSLKQYGTHHPSSSASPSSSKPPRPTQQGSHRSSSKKRLTEEDTGNRRKQIKIPAHLHKHKLTSTPAGTLFTCDGCKEQGCGLSYRCEKRDCSYVLHKECAKAVRKSEERVSHPFFEGIKFKFLEKPKGSPWICDACRMEVKGFVYHHRQPSKDLYNTGLDLHPCCFKLKKRISNKQESSSGEKITLKLQPDVPGKCMKCKHRKVKGDTKVGGWSYNLSASDGDYCFHVSCFKKLILETLEKEGFSDGKKVTVSSIRKTGFKVGGRSNSSSLGFKITKVVVKTAITVLIKLLFSLILGGGHPIALLPALLLVFKSAWVLH